MSKYTINYVEVHRVTLERRSKTHECKAEDLVDAINMLIKGYHEEEKWVIDFIDCFKVKHHA